MLAEYMHDLPGMLLSCLTLNFDLSKRFQLVYMFRITRQSIIHPGQTTRAPGHFF